MNNRLQTPLTATIVIFVCSLVAAFVAFRFLESTADYQATGIKVGGALAGLLITFIVLWRSFHSFSQELGQTDRERLQAQVKNLQNQLMRQDPPPPGYHRVINEDYRVVVHIPDEWVLGQSNFMSIFGSSSGAEVGFMHNIVFSRSPAVWFYRDIILRKKIQVLAQEYAPEKNPEFQKKVQALRLEYQQYQHDPQRENELNQKLDRLNQEYARDRNPEFQKKVQELQWEFQRYRDDPVRKDEKIADVLAMFLESGQIQFTGVPEHTEVNGFPAVRYQYPNPVSQHLVNLETLVNVNVGGGYIYTITLTAPQHVVGPTSTVYNKVLNSLRFLT